MVPALPRHPHKMLVIPTWVLILTYPFVSIGSITENQPLIDPAGQQYPASQFVLSERNLKPVELLAFATATSHTDMVRSSVALEPSESNSIEATEPTAQSIVDYVTRFFTESESRSESKSESKSESEATSATKPSGAKVTAGEAARLLAQASFGATDKAIARVQELGIEGWIDEQFTLQGPAHLDYVSVNSNGSGQEPRHDIWWLDVVNGEDQLRQRVAFALSQIFVVSDQGYTLGNAQYGITRYYDQLRENAFGQYRELLETITLSPVMGVYLSMMQNGKGDEAGNTRADENFAREVLQLFSTGLYELNADGTQKLQGGETIPVFTQAQVEDYARAFTGWNFGDAPSWTIVSIHSKANKQIPMEAWQEYHDTGAKTLLGGVTIPAGQSAEADLEIALDSIANHPNVAPFIVKQLIQKLVTSNPTPGYVGRVSAVFNNNGAGQRGDLQAVVKAMLMDVEARNGHQSVKDFGKLREPMLRLSHLWRAFGITPGTLSENGVYETRSPHVKDLDYLSGQAVMKSPSVFNFFMPAYAPLGDIYNNQQVAPEAEIYTDSTIIAMTTRVNTHIQYVHDASVANAKKSAYLNFSKERELAARSTDKLLDRLNTLMLSGLMSDGLRALLITHIDSLPPADTIDGQSARVSDALSLIMASPEYLVQR